MIVIPPLVTAVQSDSFRAVDSVRFGEDFELDFSAYELRRSGRALKLERIPMEILFLLLQERGRLVSREQIVETIWGKDVFLDTDNSINGAIRKIRQALKDDPERPRFIQTVAGKGYRFIAPTVERQAEESVVSPTPQARVRETLRWPTFRSWRIFLGIAVGLAAAVGIWLQWSGSAAHPQSAGERVMLAVLPFENLTGDSGQEYFSDGLTEEMIAQLGRTDPQHLGVIARTSVMHYKDKRESLERIGRELGAQYVLEGSVRRDAQRIRISAQLIQVRDQSHLWARQYDRELSSLLALQAEIAQEIVGEIQNALSSPQNILATLDHPRPPKNYEAYDLYLRGRFFWNKRTPQGFQHAVDTFEQAIAVDPDYARAYAGLADSYALMSSYSLAPPRELMPKARSAAIRALELDERLAEAHTSLALIALNYDWDWKTAEREYRRAIQLDPNYATAHHWYAEFLSFQGRFDEAIAESDRARQLDPLSLIIATDHGAILLYSRQYDRAIEQFRTVLDMDPTFPRANLIVAAYVEKGMFEEALAEVRKRRPNDPTPWTWVAEAHVYGRWGRKAQAQRALEQFQRANRRWQLEPACVLPGVYASMNDKERAITWLQKAYQARCNGLTVLKVNPGNDNLRGDPRFHDLLRQVGLEQDGPDLKKSTTSGDPKAGPGA